MKKLLLLAALVLMGLLAGWLLSRTPAPEKDPIAQAPVANPELAAAEKSSAPLPRLPPQRNEPKSQDLQPSVERQEPPEDPDEIRQWTRDNPALALAWLMNAAAGPQRDAVAEITCAQVAETDPARAAELAERYAGGNSNLLENLVFQWSDRNEPEARAYALKKPAGEERDRLLARVALSRAKTEPAEAAKFVVAEMSPGETQNEAVMSVLHQWALREPYQALAWVQLFPESDLRSRALTEIENILRKSSGE
jgi:hypothetical protein